MLVKLGMMAKGKGEKKMESRDLVIIGGGPAGLSAAVYASRYKLDSLILSGEVGGTAATAHKVCNFPTYTEISGFDLMQKMHKQVEDLNVEIKYEAVSGIKKNGKGFIIKTQSQGEYLAKKIIYATGTGRRKLDIPGEKEFAGKGVSYCATCDAAFFKDKIVGVVGGGDAALTSALLLADHSKKVYIIYRNGKFSRAEPAWVDLVMKKDNIKIIFNETVKEIKGKESLQSAVLESGKILDIEGLFIEIGSVPNNSPVFELNVDMEKGYLKTDSTQKTSIRGFFAAGDISTSSGMLKQIITASAEGVIAAHSAYVELTKGD